MGYSPKGRKESDTTEATEAACKNVFEFHSLQFQLTSSWAVTCEDEKCLIRNLPYYVPSLQKCKLLRLQKDLNIMCYLKKKGMNQVSVSEGQLRQKHRCTIHIMRCCLVPFQGRRSERASLERSQAPPPPASRPPGRPQLLWETQMDGNCFLLGRENVPHPRPCPLGRTVCRLPPELAQPHKVTGILSHPLSASASTWLHQHLYRPLWWPQHPLFPQC